VTEFIKISWRTRQKQDTKKSPRRNMSKTNKKGYNQEIIAETRMKNIE
jgi:hypothetical protein